jgi:phage terminase Nu1 subunit (DNA packaging protein)
MGLALGGYGLTLDLNQAVTHERFAGLIGVSRVAVTQMITQGILVDGDPVGRWLLVYTSRLREEAAGRSTDQLTERTRLEKAKADYQELVNGEKRGELVKVTEVRRVFATVSRRAAAILEGVPAKLKREIAGVTDESLALIEEKLNQARAELADIDFDATEETEVADALV